jgi:hypothetical protein
MPTGPQVDGNKIDNVCHYIDCILCKTNTTRKNVHAFHKLQHAFFASNSFSLQAIYDTFYAEKPITNFGSFSELHNEFQLVQKDLVPTSLIIAATIQKLHSSIPLKALFDPGSDLTFIHERCIPKGATPVVSSTTTGTTLAGTFTTSCFVKLEKILFPKFHRSCRIDSHTCYLLAGTFTTSRFIKLEKILLPEFHHLCRVVVRFGSGQLPYGKHRVDTRQTECTFTSTCFLICLFSPLCA